MKGQRAKRTDDAGRAFAGSQHQLQLYVSRHREVLDSAILRAAGLRSGLEWVSPLQLDQFKEYKDAAFLRALGLSHLTGQLRQFWPASGPRWDGLARTVGRDPVAVVLVEAKNYPREVRGGGCKASDVGGARQQILAALESTAKELGVSDSKVWMGPLYQYANRIAHAAFLRRNGVDAFMVNVCFYNDPHLARRTTESEWRQAAIALKGEIGFTAGSPPWLSDVFLPAADGAEFLGAAI